MRQLDLNADVGEGLPETDAALLELVTSANIACGLHAGDPHTIRKTLAMAVQHGVAVGAHPGFDDRDGFCRRPLQLDATELADLIHYPIGASYAIGCVEGAAPGSAALAARIRQELGALGVSVSAPRLLGVDTLPP